MKFKIPVIILVSLLILCLACKAQNIAENTHPIQEEWFVYSMSGEKNSCTIYEDKIIFKSPWDTQSPKGIDTVYLETQKGLPINHVIAHNEGKKEPYGIFKIVKSPNGKKIAMTPIVSGNNAQEVVQKLAKEGVPDWIDLRKQILYSSEMIKVIDVLPGLDKVTPEDMLTALQWREPLSIKLQAYLEDTNGSRSFMIYRFVENYRNERLIELGYNPYKQVIYNLEEQFKDAPEVLKLLKEEIKF